MIEGTREPRFGESCPIFLDVVALAWMYFECGGRSCAYSACHRRRCDDRFGGARNWPATSRRARCPALRDADLVVTQGSATLQGDAPSFREFLAEHRQSALRLGPGRFVLQHIPMFGGDAASDARRDTVVATMSGLNP